VSHSYPHHFSISLMDKNKHFLFIKVIAENQEKYY